MYFYKGKAIDKKEGSSTKLFNSGTKSPIINNNLSNITGSAPLSPAQGDVKCAAALFKKVMCKYFIIIDLCLNSSLRT